jgi:hypothetical protein
MQPAAPRLRARRGAAVVLAVAMLAAGVALDAGTGADAAVAGFIDVPPTAYYANAVAWAKEHAITTGTDSSRFQPAREVTRAEAITFLWRAAGRPTAPAASMADVPRADYYAGAVDWAVEQGITTGVSPGRFEPHRVITRAESVVFLWRHAGSPSAPTTGFADVAAYGWALPAISWADDEGVTTGVGGNRFAPSRVVTRAEAITMLWRSSGAPVPPPPPPSASGFAHPGVVVGRAQLDYVRAKLAAGAQPWTSALDDMLGSGGSVATATRPHYSYSSLSYPPAPVPSLQAAGGGNTAYLQAHPEEGRLAGGVEHLDDARAAYTHALLWYYTGNQAYANKAIQIMNAWSSTLREIKWDQPVRADNGARLYDQGKMQAGWGASLFSRAGEIIRYSGAGWSEADAARFGTMLHDVYLPLVISGWSNGANWMMTLAEATMGIGVYTDDRAAFDAGVAMWRRQAPSTIYMPSDGPLPIPPDPAFNTEAELRSLWYGPMDYVAGLQTETLRDLSHMAMGLGAMSNAAETAGLQGIDLFGEQRARIIAGFELNARYVNEYLDRVASAGGVQPASVWRPSGWVGSTFSTGGSYYDDGWEVAYNHYASQGIPMPNTARLVLRSRPSDPALHNSWETLTHAR